MTGKLKSAPVRYGTRFGCRWGHPHNFTLIKDTASAKYERCLICGERKRWNKAYSGRIDNNEYLKAHVRNYAQESGSTKRVYSKLYKPEKTTIII